jgi:hypothetical protein
VGAQAVGGAQPAQDGVQTNRLHAGLQFAGSARSLLDMPRARLIALPSLLLALVLAGCGSGAGAAGADPASAVPQGTAIYFQGTLRPEGDQRDDVLDAARKVLRTDDPERKLHELIDKGLKDSDNGDVTYEKDFAPWLGQKAGVWVSGVNRAKPGYVVIVATKDTDKAQEAIDKGAKADGGKVKQRSYSGVDYQLDRDGVAAGIVGDFFTVGTEPEFKRTIKAQDGASLAEEKRYQRTMGALDDKRIGQFYIDLKPFLEQALKSDPRAAGQLEQFRSLFPIDKLEPVGGALLADGDRIAVDSITRGKGVKALKALGPLAGTGSTPLLGELPGDAWVAFGAADVGPSFKHVFDSVAGALGGTVAAQQLKRQYGIDLDRDVFSWIGDIALYARHTTRADIDGALVIEATNPTTMRTAFGKLVGLIQSQGGQKVTPIRVKGAAAAFKAGSTDLGKPVVLARSDDRVVVALGASAAAEALAPAAKLGDSELFGQAKSILGGDLQPAFLLSMPDLLSAIQSMGKPDAGFAKAKPYLDAFSVLSSGGSLKGDEARSRVAAGLK